MSSAVTILLKDTQFCIHLDWRVRLKSIGKLTVLDRLGLSNLSWNNVQIWPIMFRFWPDCPIKMGCLYVPGTLGSDSSYPVPREGRETGQRSHSAGDSSRTPHLIQTKTNYIKGTDPARFWTSSFSSLPNIFSSILNSFYLKISWNKFWFRSFLCLAKLTLL